MFIRNACRNTHGKSHHYWVLLESYRTAQGLRHRTVAYLGEVDEAARLGIQQAALNHPGYQTSLLEGSIPEWVEVDVRLVSAERTHRFGNVRLALELLKQLGLNQFSQEALACTHPKISWAEIGSVLVVALFCEPLSELHVAEHFYSQSTLADLLGILAIDVYDNHLYRALDKLLGQKGRLQKYLKEG